MDHFTVDTSDILTPTLIIHHTTIRTLGTPTSTNKSSPLIVFSARVLNVKWQRKLAQI